MQSPVRILHSSFFILHLNLVLFVQCRVIQHRRADAELAVLGYKDIVVYASFASLPKSVVVCQFVEGDRHVPQFSIHLHHGRTTGEAEYLSPRPSQACQAEGGLFDALGQSDALVFGMYDETRCGYILFVAPTLDVAESGKLRAVQGDDGFAFLHLGGYIFVCTLGDARAALLGGLADGVEYGVYINFMGGVCHHDFYFLYVHFYLLFYINLYCLNIRYGFRQKSADILVRGFFGQHQHDGVIAGDGA